MTNLTNKLFLPVFMLLLSISPALAHNDTFFNSPHRLELKPASFAEPGYRLAKSYWLGGAEITLNFKGDDDDTICQAKGYITGACKGNETPIKYCGAGNKYHLCGCDASVYRYSVSNCVSGSLPNDDICGDYSSGCVCDGAFVWNSDSNSCDFYCSSNYDCPGQVCRTSSGDCVDCVYDSDCGSGQVCTDNKCETADLCASVNCTGGQTCNASTGECECPSGQILSDGQCEQADCSNGGIICSGSTPVCAENGQCVQCLVKGDCDGDKECINNICEVVDACKNVTCEGGKECVDGVCVCPSGKIDNNGICEGPDCANGGISCSGSTPVCAENGQCVECTSNSHCSGGKECSGNVCKCPSSKPYLSGSTCVECTSDSQCSGGKECSGNVCKCPSSKPYLSGSTCVECTSDSQCSDGKKCISNFCQTVDACEGITCAGGKTCVNGDCICPSGQIDNSGTCEAPDCANGGVTCTGGKVCQNKVCVCPSDKPYESGGKCVECSTNSHCSNGKTCQSGICACPSGQSIFNGICEIPNCVNGGVTCPSGQTCNSTTKLCEAVETCRTQAEAKGYKLVETASELAMYAQIPGSEIAVSGDVSGTAEAMGVSFYDAADVVGGLCQSGKITFTSLKLDGENKVSLLSQIGDLGIAASGSGSLQISGQLLKIGDITVASGETMTLKFDDSNETIDIDSIENSGSLSMVAPKNPEFTVGEMRLRGKTLTTGGTYVLGGMTQVYGLLTGNAVFLAGPCDDNETYPVIDIIGQGSASSSDMEHITFQVNKCPLGVGGNIFGAHFELRNAAIIPSPNAKSAGMTAAYVFPREFIIFDTEIDQRRGVLSRTSSDYRSCVIELRFSQMRDSLHSFSQLLSGTAPGIGYNQCDVEMWN